jgi:flagellar hook-associated protein 2
MGSPITFSGLNGIDFGMILNAIMQQERQPLTRLETQKTTFKGQTTAFANLAAKLGTLQDAGDALGENNGLAVLKASSSDTTAVGVSATSGTLEGTYSVAVTDLARAQVLTSSSTYDSLTDVIATSGTIRFTKSGGTPVDLVIGASTTLQDLASQINALDDVPVRAAVVQVSPGQYKLALTGAETGTANAFTVEFAGALAGGEGLTYATGNGNAIFGDDASENSQTALNATLTVNGIPIVSSTNSITSAIPGATLSLLQANASSTISVTRDAEASIGNIKKFVTAYNDIISFLKDQNTAAIAGKASISRDPMVTGFRNQLRQTLLGTYGTGDFTRLPAVGIGFDITGQMQLDEDVLEEALAANQNDVQSLFSSAFSSLNTMIENYTKVDGLLASARERLGVQVENIDARLGALEGQLELRRATLQKEFIAADMAISQLNSQGGSLAGLANQYRLF